MSAAMVRKAAKTLAPRFMWGHSDGVFGSVSRDTLGEARADVLKIFKRHMRYQYPEHRCVCAWSPVEVPQRSDKPFMRSDTQYWTSCDIWEVRGKKKVKIPGWLTCVATEKV